jgi:hypothetical protein
MDEAVTFRDLELAHSIFEDLYSGYLFSDKARS